MNGNESQERKGPMAAYPRVAPTPQHLQAIVGTWKLRDQTVRLTEEEGSGILLAFNERGEPINPMQVISRGTKLGAN
jgi:hypothetical protein